MAPARPTSRAGGNQESLFAHVPARAPIAVLRAQRAGPAAVQRAQHRRLRAVARRGLADRGHPRAHRAEPDQPAGRAREGVRDRGPRDRLPRHPRGDRRRDPHLRRMGRVLHRRQQQLTLSRKGTPMSDQTPPPPPPPQEPNYAPQPAAGSNEPNPYAANPRPAADPYAATPYAASQSPYTGAGGPPPKQTLSLTSFILGLAAFVLGWIP